MFPFIVVFNPAVEDYEMFLEFKSSFFPFSVF